MAQPVTRTVSRQDQYQGYLSVAFSLDRELSRRPLKATEHIQATHIQATHIQATHIQESRLTHTPVAFSI